MVVDCPKCKAPFEEKGPWGKKKFCSRNCANSHVRTQESKNKTSNTLKGRKTNRVLTEEQELARATKFKETLLKRYNDTPFDELGMENRRRRVFEEQDHKCIKCNADEWFGHKLILELEHKDGNHQNNERSNLEGLCPNCHSITDTWRGRNKKLKRIKDEDLLECLKSTDNIRQALLNAGLAAKGHNYKRAYKLLETITDSHV